jgi:hypothetical protein
MACEHPNGKHISDCRPAAASKLAAQRPGSLHGLVRRWGQQVGLRMNVAVEILIGDVEIGDITKDDLIILLLFALEEIRLSR